ncbi:hypothetical protein DFH11DRAFT_1784161 [Phellopilus nigrolimitatus]|nr:hypothetical protein DFH11DRAFT_1784161 [Phellopilus nigrolimitatus]
MRAVNLIRLPYLIGRAAIVTGSTAGINSIAAPSSSVKRLSLPRSAKREQGNRHDYAFASRARTLASAQFKTKAGFKGRPQILRSENATASPNSRGFGCVTKNMPGNELRNDKTLSNVQELLQVRLPQRKAEFHVDALWSVKNRNVIQLVIQCVEHRISNYREDNVEYFPTKRKEPVQTSSRGSVTRDSMAQAHVPIEHVDSTVDTENGIDKKWGEYAVQYAQRCAVAPPPSEFNRSSSLKKSLQLGANTPRSLLETITDSAPSTYSVSRKSRDWRVACGRNKFAYTANAKKHYPTLQEPHYDIMPRVVDKALGICHARMIKEVGYASRKP